MEAYNCPFLLPDFHCSVIGCIPFIFTPCGYGKRVTGDLLQLQPDGFWGDLGDPALPDSVSDENGVAVA